MGLAILYLLFGSKAKPAASRYQALHQGGVEAILTGPAWQVLHEVARNIEPNALCMDTCWIFRTAIGHPYPTRFFGPDGAGTAVCARVRVGRDVSEDLYVVAKTPDNAHLPGPFKGALWMAPVNWNRAVLTGDAVDPERGVYNAVLEVTTDELARHSP
jgi:hypothetical protein